MTKSAELKQPIVNQDEVNSGATHDFIFQFICAETGHRSEPFLSNWTQLHEVLNMRTEEQPKPADKDYILLVAVMDKEQTHIPNSPLITVESYLKTMNAEFGKPEKEEK